jgi:hypothetical protein
MDETMGEYVDRAVNIEMRYGSGLPRGVTHLLYDAARAAQGAPLTWLAAKALHERVKAGDRVLVVTGAGSWPWLPKGETDGPLGAAAIAHALDAALSAKPVLVAEERNMGPVLAASAAVGLMTADDALFEARTGVVLPSPFPLGSAAGEAEALRLMDKHKPAAIVFVEKAGVNQNGLFHSILGTSRTDGMMANAHHLIPLAKARGVVTIGIGDGGNEIGFGMVVEAVRDIQPFGRVSKNPADGGVATVTATDVLVSAAVSNWGAYGVAAMLAALVRNPDALHGVDAERRMLIDCVKAGGMDGAVAKMVPLVDGTSPEVQTGLLTILHEIVRNGLKTFERPF